MTFRSTLPPEVQAQLQTAREQEQTYKVTFANMDDASLAASAEFWMQHCVAPRRVLPDEPIYDSTFWHVIVPEMIRRLRK